MLGIVVLHYVFRGLVHILSRYTKIPVHILRHVVRFMPFMTGICAGIYAADSFMELPDFVENHIDMIFYNVVAVTVILFLAHLISAFLQYKMTQSQARNYGSNLEQVERVTQETARSVLNKSQYGVTGFEPAVRYKELGEYGISFDVVLRIRNVVDEAVLKHQFIKAIYQAYQDNGIHLLERTA